ncbi:hypothetical protein L2D01_12140 [Hyphomonadaceae bacterium ML37]|nr:hypothetical protein L2D01_12140 [Hyphomonadaceae bacterium ML37]
MSARTDWRTRPLVLCEPGGYLRRLTVDILRNAGATRVTAVDDADGALWFMRQTRRAILVAGWQENPEAGDAADLVRRLRQDASPAGLAPSLIVSSRREFADMERARDAGVDALVLRPVAPNDIIVRLDQLVRRRRPFVRSEHFAGPDRRIRPGSDAAFKRNVDVTAGLTTPIEAARAQAYAMITRMRRRKDPLAERVGKSLARSLENAQALGPKEAEITALHRATLAKLEALHGAPGDVRAEIVDSLERLTARRRAA